MLKVKKILYLIPALAGMFIISSCSRGNNVPVQAVIKQAVDFENYKVYSIHLGNVEENPVSGNVYGDDEEESGSNPIVDNSTLSNVVCWTTTVDDILGTEVKIQGRLIANGNEAFPTGTKIFPSSIARDTKMGIKSGEENPNPLNPSMLSFIDRLAKDNSYESFSNYLEWLNSLTPLHNDEKEEFNFNWRKYHNALTDEDKAKIQAEDNENKSRETEWEKMQEDYQKSHEKTAEELEKSKMTLYSREVEMIKRNLADWIVFDEEKYISLREKGYDYLDALKESETIDYSKANDSLTKTMEENRVWFNENYDKLTDIDFFQNFKDVYDNLGEFFTELFGLNKNKNSNDEGESD